MSQDKPHLSNPAPSSPEVQTSEMQDTQGVEQLLNDMFLGNEPAGIDSPAHPVGGGTFESPQVPADPPNTFDIAPINLSAPSNGSIDAVPHDMAGSPNSLPMSSPVQSFASDLSPLTGTNTSQAAMPGDIPITMDGLQFQVPQEIALLPEPQDLHALLGSPNPPKGILHDKDATEPYWLAAKATETDAERQFQPLDILPVDVDLKPSHIVEHQPAPPARPPAKPPSKEWTLGKLVAMSGQDFTDDKQDTIPDAQPAAKAFYWAPSSNGVKQGGDKTASSALHEKGFFDVDVIRKDFPILKQKVNGKPLVWLDNAATTQKPQAVIDRISKFYEEENSNVHRAAHDLAAKATDAYEAAREKIRKFMGAGSVEEIVFTRGTTESINLVSQTYGKQHLGPGDEIIVTEMEHHSNIVPWQIITKETGSRIVVAPFHDSGELDLGAYERLFNKRTKMVAITHVSNALGTVNPVQQMVATAHRHGAIALVDGAQSMPHFPVNVREIDADFYVMSGHKLFGPTGVGVLYGKKHLLDEMPPWQGGGNMIEHVSFEETRYNPPPYKFEAGTGILAAATGLGAAVDYLERIGFMNAARYEDALLEYAQDKLRAINGVKMIGEARHKAGVMSFVTDNVSPDEMGQALNQEGIAVRTGHHCAQPALAHYGLTATIRPSIAFYNTRDEIDLLVATVIRTMKAKG